MTNQNVVVSDAKSGMGRVKITVTLSNNSIFPSPPMAKMLPSPDGGCGGGYITISTKDVLKRLESGKEIGSKITAWVDSMRDSSPPRVRSSASSLSEADQEDNSWIARHPSALKMFEEIVNISEGKKIVMFLDYDGTLSPIVEDPDRAFMTTEMRKAVRDVARYFPTAIVTGRCRDKVFSFVKLSGLYYAGSHGMDIEGPTKRRKYKKGNQGVMFQAASEFLPMIDEVYKTLVEKTEAIPGAKVENNKFCVSVHFRCVDEKRWASLAEQVRLVLNQYPQLKLTQGRKVFEIRPTIKWDKGRALEFLLEALGYANCEDVVPVYIGDDQTDEDAFKVLRNRGQGIGIVVSKVPKETNANYSLQDPSEVKEFLRRLVQWRRTSLGATLN